MALFPKFAKAAGVTFEHRQKSLIALAKRGLLNEVMLTKVPFDYSKVGVSTGIDYAIELAAQGRKRSHMVGFVPKDLLEKGYGKDLLMGSTAKTSVFYRGQIGGRFGIRYNLPEANSFVSNASKDKLNIWPYLFGGAGVAAVGSLLANFNSTQKEEPQDITNNLNKLNTDTGSSFLMKGLGIGIGVSAAALAIPQSRKALFNMFSKFSKSGAPSEVIETINKETSIASPISRDVEIQRKIAAREARRLERLRNRPYQQQDFGPLQQGKAPYIPSGGGLTEASKTTSTQHFRKTLGVINKVFAETRTPFTAKDIQAISYMMPRTKPENFMKTLGLKGTSLSRLQKQAGAFMTWKASLARQGSKYPKVTYEEVLKTMIFRAASKERIRETVIGAGLSKTAQSSAVNKIAAVQEEFLLRSRQNKELWDIFGLARTKNPRDTWSWFSGTDDAWNSIEGFNETGLSSELRKLLTDFGSGWDPLRAIARQAAITFEELVKTKEFKQSILKGRLIKQLAGANAGSSSVDLMEGTFRGNVFKYVKKNIKDFSMQSSVDRIESMTNEFMADTTQKMARKEIETAISLGKLSKPQQYDITPNIYGFTRNKSQKIRSIYQEYIEGSTINELLENPKGFQEFRAQNAPAKIREYLSYIRERGIAHGDIHPGNIIMTPKSPTGFSIIDWGLSHSLPPTNIQNARAYVKETTAYFDELMRSPVVSSGVDDMAIRASGNMVTGRMASVAAEGQKAAQQAVEGGFAPAAPELRHLAAEMPNAMAHNVQTHYMKNNVPLSTKIKIKGNMSKARNTDQLVQAVSANIPKSKVNISVRDQRTKLTPQVISDMIDK